MNNGSNPLRYSCERNGCFNHKLRPKIELFCDCFPGKISFGDVDGEVEINGKFAQLEWKTRRDRKIPQGQDIKFREYTRQPGWCVFVAVGDAEKMLVEAVCVYWNGKRQAWQEFPDNDGFAYLWQRIAGWAKFAKEFRK